MSWLPIGTAFPAWWVKGWPGVPGPASKPVEHPPPPSFRVCLLTPLRVCWGEFCAALSSHRVPVCLPGSCAHRPTSVFPDYSKGTLFFSLIYKHLLSFLLLYILLSSFLNPPFLVVFSLMYFIPSCMNLILSETPCCYLHLKWSGKEGSNPAVDGVC